jgi:hypothetical protein
MFIDVNPLFDKKYYEKKTKNENHQLKGFERTALGSFHFDLTMKSSKISPYVTNTADK